jgi:hypothetical protein
VKTDQGKVAAAQLLLAPQFQLFITVPAAAAAVSAAAAAPSGED